MITLSSKVKFSYSISKGNISARKKLTENLNEKIFRRMVQLYGTKNSCGLGAIKSSYNALIPEHKFIEITPLRERDYDEFGGGVRFYEKNNSIIGYTIELPANKKKKMNILELSSLMHESTHILDYLTNPKYIANLIKMREYDIYNKDYFEIYEKYFYPPNIPYGASKNQTVKAAESETRSALQNVSTKEKIVFLTYMKYCMEMENHAYCEDIKFARILKKLGKPTDKESLEDLNQYYFFPEKIRLINRLIMEELSKRK